MSDSCAVCGHDQFVHQDVLWPALIAAWELNPDEARYIDVQQGTSCARCSTSVRAQALVRAVARVVGWTATFEDFLAQAPAALRVLEINEASTLTPWFARLPGHEFARYPACDMLHLGYPDERFDLVIHSDTLEHVTDPLRGLRECWRVTTASGACVFTVPIIVGRLTRSRVGLPASYHGHPDTATDDMRVYTEFGADIWCSVLAAGFATCELVPFQYPAGLAVIARRGRS